MITLQLIIAVLGLLTALISLIIAILSLVKACQARRALYGYINAQIELVQKHNRLVDTLGQKGVLKR